MKKPKIDRFVKDDPNSRIKPEEVDMSGVPAIKKPSAKSKRKPKTTRPASKPVGQSVSQSTDQSTSRLTNKSSNKIVDRPKAFYITERLDKKLDEAVRYFKEKHGIKKVDRSTIVNAVMDNVDSWTDESLDKLVDRVISQLTSRLTS